MLDKEKMILENFGKVIPTLTEAEKERLLAFGEGMAFMAERQKKTKSRRKDSDRSEQAAAS